MNELTHFDAHGASRMVDVAAKPISQRLARVVGRVRMRQQTLALVRDRKLTKGDVLEVARLAGIMAAKQTASLIPLCHQVPLDSVELTFDFEQTERTHAAEGSLTDVTNADSGVIRIVATARATARTGVEIEAFVAVSTAALTIYDMCKAIDREMVIEQLQLLEKSGGRSGHFVRDLPA